MNREPARGELEARRTRTGILDEQVEQLIRTEEKLMDTQRTLEHQVARVTSFEKFAARLNGARDPENAARMALACALQSMPADAGVALFACSDGTHTMRVTAAHGQPDMPAESIDSAPVLQALDDGEISRYEQLIDGPLSDHPAIRAVVSHAMRACSSSARVARTLVLPLTRPTGSPHGVLVAVKLLGTTSVPDMLATPVDLPLFRVLGHLLERALDTAAHKQQTEALLAARDAVEAGRRAKHRFLSNVNHEIRTPVSGIIGSLELLSEEPLSREQRQHVGVIRTCANSLMALINDVLEFSRMEAGQFNLTSHPFSLGDVLYVAEQSLRFYPRSPHVTFSLERAEDVPDQLLGDSDRLTQVLVNLCKNALKFTPRGTVSLRVSTLPESQSLRFEVEDTGIGFAAEHMRRVFEPFRQLDASSTRAYGGTGLGLSICAQIVEAMGGQIGVSSVVGHGSTFWFTIPRRLPEKAGSHRPAERPPTRTGPAIQPGSTARILVVDDNLLNQRIVASLLSRLGCKVECACDGEQAVDAASQNGFDIILMDCQMPRMDGYQATIEIRALRRHRYTPIIALTANASGADRARCLKVGMSDYVSKPVTSRQLRELVTRWHGRPQQTGC